MNQIYADTIGMTAPFLCRYGKLRGESGLVKLGVMQIVHFLDHGMDEKTGLPYHGFDSATGMKYGCVGWGRAVGWLMMGIAETLACLPEQTPQFPFMQGHLQRLTRTVAEYQRQDGSFLAYPCFRRLCRHFRDGNDRLRDSDGNPPGVSGG